MTEEITDRRLHATMRRTARAMFHRGHRTNKDRHARRYAPSQERILATLVKRDESIAQSELLELLNIRPSSLSELLGKMETKGYIERTTSEGDGRAVDVSITDAGRELLEEVREVHRRRDEELFGILTDEERVQLASILDKLSAHWKEISEERERRFNEDGPHPDRETVCVRGRRK